MRRSREERREQAAVELSERFTVEELRDHLETATHGGPLARLLARSIELRKARDVEFQKLESSLALGDALGDDVYDLRPRGRDICDPGGGMDFGRGLI